MSKGSCVHHQVQELNPQRTPHPPRTLVCLESMSKEDLPQHLHKVQIAQNPPAIFSARVTQLVTELCPVSSVLRLLQSASCRL